MDKRSVLSLLEESFHYHYYHYYFVSDVICQVQAYAALLGLQFRDSSTM